MTSSNWLFILSWNLHSLKRGGFGTFCEGFKSGSSLFFPLISYTTLGAFEIYRWISVLEQLLNLNNEWHTNHTFAGVILLRLAFYLKLSIYHLSITAWNSSSVFSFCWGQRNLPKCHLTVHECHRLKYKKFFGNDWHWMLLLWCRMCQNLKATCFRIQ